MIHRSLIGSKAKNSKRVDLFLKEGRDICSGLFFGRLLPVLRYSFFVLLAVWTGHDPSLLALFSRMHHR
jgi:hypothetical protein